MNAQMIYDRCATKLLRMYPFWGSLLLGFEVRQSKDVPAMKTDGITLTYNPDWVQDQNEAIVCTCQAHEAGHKMFRDHLRRKHRDKDLWTIACDYRINLYLRDSGLVLGDNFLVDERFRGLDAEEIYDLLQQNPDDPANQQAAEKGGCGCGGLSDHPSTTGQPQPEQSDDGDGEGEGNGESEDSPTSKGNGASNVDFGEAEVLMAVAQARAFAKGRGSVPGDLDEMITELLDPKVRWDQVLQRFMENCSQDDFSWQLPDRRFLYLDMYLPGIESEGVDTFVVAVDTSGSTIRHIPEFLGNVSQIARVLKFQTLHVVYCDAKIQHVDEYTRDDLPIRPGHYGGGGTDFRPVFNWIEENAVEPKGVVYLTDTEGPFPSAPPSCPVLWVVPGDREVTVPFGEVVQLN